MMWAVIYWSKLLLGKLKFGRAQPMKIKWQLALMTLSAVSLGTFGQVNNIHVPAIAQAATVQSGRLHYKTITPKQTAAAIAYYGDHKVKRGCWKGLTSQYGKGLDLYQFDNANHLNVPGRGNSWSLRPSKMNGGAQATYTIGANGDVAFYNVNTRNQNKDKDPLAVVNLRKIISYVNNHGKSQLVVKNADAIHVKENQGNTTNNDHVINNANDAARLVAHAMAASDDLYSATPVKGGFEVVRHNPTQKAFVHYDGSVTWDDGTTQPYSEVSANESNGKVNDTFATSDSNN